jgi:Sulfotransferase family
MPQATHNPVTDTPVRQGSSLRGSRSTAPVFVVGCPRSGTTYLYHVLLSAGNFAVYRAESQVFHMLEPRFGDLSVAGHRKNLLASWFQSRLFTATGLQREPLQERILRECHNGGDFLRIVMEETAQHQGVKRWAECTPDHVLYLPRIKQTIPEALVIHMIRDGRDVALSMEKQGWPRQLPWDRLSRRMAGGVYWEWMTREGQREGAQLGPDYIEVRYEDLVGNPREVLHRLSSFISQELNYDEIQRVAIGSVKLPNTSFTEEAGSASFAPIGRWKNFYSPEQLLRFEALVGTGLKQFGYALSGKDESASSGLNFFRAQYWAWFAAKFYLRAKTPLGRLLVTRNLSKM